MQAKTAIKKGYIGMIQAMLWAAAVLWVIPASPAGAEEKMPGVIQTIGAGFEIEGVIPEMRSMLVGLGQPIVYHAQVNP